MAAPVTRNKDSNWHRSGICSTQSANGSRASRRGRQKTFLRMEDGRTLWRLPLVGEAVFLRRCTRKYLTVVALSWKRSRNPDRSNVCVDGGRSRALSEEPRRGLLRGPAAQAERIGAEPAATAHHQGGGPISPHVAGAGGAFNSEPAGPGYGSEALGTEAGPARRQECQEAGHRGGGAEVGGAAAPVVGRRRSVRTVAQQPADAGGQASRLREWFEVVGVLNPSPSSGDCE